MMYIRMLLDFFSILLIMAEHMRNEIPDSTEEILVYIIWSWNVQYVFTLIQLELCLTSQKNSCWTKLDLDWVIIDMSHWHLFLQMVQIFVCGLVSHVQDHLAVFSLHSLCLDDFLLHQAVCWDKPGLVRIKTYMRTHSPPYWPSSSRITHWG